MRDACQRRAPVPRVWHGCGVLQNDGFTGAADEAMSMDVRNVYRGCIAYTSRTRTDRRA